MMNMTENQVWAILAILLVSTLPLLVIGAVITEIMNAGCS